MVLEGGGLRGLYTAGILDVFMENNIKVDGIIGVSAGALFGVNYFSNQNGRVIRYNKKYCNDKRYMSIRSFFLTGNYINKDFAFYKMSNELDKFDNAAFLNTKKAFYAVATRVRDGKAEYFKITDPMKQLEELRASAAIPFISKKVKINDEYYLDGGVADSIPIDKCMKLGYKKIIIIETQPIDYVKKPLNKKMAQAIKVKYWKYPNLVNSILDRYERYNATKKKIKELEKKGDVFVIRPKRILDIDMKNKDAKKYQEIYDLGVEDAKACMNNLKKYLEK